MFRNKKTMNVKDKTAIVTGATGGIGFSTVQELLRHGAKCVAMFDLPTSNGESFVKKLDAEFGKGRAVFIPCDVSNDEQFRSSFKKAVEILGDPDILVNNAGMLDDNRWEQTISVNFTAVVRGTIVFIDHVGKHNGGKGGTIVNIGSVLGLVPGISMVVYSATKHGVVGFSRAVDGNSHKTGVRVLVLCPGYTDTAIIENTKSKFLNFVDPTQSMKKLSAMTCQSPQNVSRAVIELIETGESASVYVSENNEPPYAIEIPYYKTLKKP